MSRISLAALFLFLLYSIDFNLSAQTVLYPGDIAVVGVATDLAICGLPPESDEISFFCYQDIQMGTVILVTDNGWETGSAGLWGDNEGTLQITRVGNLIPAGTVITLQATNDPGGWNYRITNPALGWTVNQINIPGGPFNLEPGGDQLFFMQGGTWDNQGAGGNDALYDGDVLFGYNSIPVWNANGTSHHSNLHPDVSPCYYTTAPGSEFYKYTGDFTPGTIVDWSPRIQDPSFWTSAAACNGYNSTSPDYANGFVMDIEPLELSVFCTFCDMCPGVLGTMYFALPPGQHDVVFTNGTDTITLHSIENFHNYDITADDTISYWLLSVTPVSGCPIPPHFTDMATFNVPHNDPGLHRDLIVCEDYPYAIPLLNMLNGTPDPGGTWSPILAFGTYYYTQWGPGTWTYVIRHPQPWPMPECPADTASVTIIFSNADGTTIEVGCDQNGTPNNIFDDATTILVTANGNNLGPTYWVTVSSGTITPLYGTTGVPSLFTLNPGSATGPTVTLTIHNQNQPNFELFNCEFDFEIEAPGYCSDPCDPSMEAAIDGDEEVCKYNCPDEPATFNVEVSGGTPPYTMDISINAPSFPTWNITDIEVQDFSEFEICIDSIPAPVYNAGTQTLTLPAALAGNEAIITLQNVYDYYNCTAILTESEVYLTIYDLPHLDTVEISLCSSMASSFDLTVYDSDINPFYDVTWYDGNPLTVGDLIPSPHVADLTNVVDLWARVEDDYCVNAIRVPFTIRSSPDLDSIPPIEICRGDGVLLEEIPIVDHGDSVAVYTYYINAPFDTTTLLDTAYYVPADSVTIYLLAEANGCYDTLAIDINIQDYPEFLLQTTPCNLLLNTYSVQFSSTADSIHTTHGIIGAPGAGQFEINGIPNDTSITIEILNPSGLCRDTFAILAPNCDCPTIDQPIAAQPSYAICEGSPVPVLTVMVASGLTANWYTVPSGGVPILQNSLTYQPAGMTSATYYVEALDPTNGCYSIRTAIPFTVHPVAILQNVADPVLCESETINLDALVPGILNGVNGTGGWFNLSDNQPASGILQPVNGQSWYYLFQSTSGNCTSTDTISAIVHQNPSMDVYQIVCDDLTLTYAIYFTSGAEDIQVNTGTLVQIPSTDSFYIQSVPFNTDLQFILENLSTGCVTNLVQPAPNCSCPDLLQQTDVTVCSDQGNVDLTAFEGFGVTGAWTLTGTPAGSNPATLAGTMFNGQGADAGLYTLRFIRNVILANCIDTAFFELTLLTSPAADAGMNGRICAPDLIQLNGSAAGNNLQFSWQTTGSGTLSNPAILNPTYTPSLADITAGSVSFTLIATDQSGACPSAQETITMTIDGSAYFILDAATQTYCDTSDMLVDMDAFITYGTTGGHWFFLPPVTAPITGNSQFNPSDLSAGNYTLYYTTSNAVPPCTNDTVGINLIIENCLCPSVALSTPTDALCSASGTVDLNNFLITTEPGSWSITGTPAGSSPALLNGTIFTTQNSDAGTYRLRFTLANPVTGCDDFAEIDFNVIRTPSLQVLTVECADDLQSWQAIIVSDAEEVVNSLGTITPMLDDHYLVDLITLNQPMTVTVSNGNGLCSTSQQIQAPDCACTLAISNLPDEASICPGETITYEPTITGGKGIVTSFWIVGNDSLHQTSLEIGQAGDYTFVSVDELGCKEEHLIVVTLYEEMVWDVSAQDINCPGDQDGSIILHDIQGGNGPYFISIHNGILQPVTAFPYTISQLGMGQYEIQLVDGFNCSVTFEVMISPASTETLNLGADQTILVGDSILLQPFLSFTPDSFYWAGSTEEIDVDLLSQWIKPEEDVTLTLFGIDDKGCVYSDDIFIRVLLSSSIYIPNVFSPNGDGINDLLAPLTDPSITSIDYFEIYSRWGELVYSAHDLVPNQAGAGWDGSFHEEPMLPGVYVYRIGATNKRGKVYELYGDLTLVR